MVQRLLKSGLVPGVHFCTLNLEKSVRTILEATWPEDDGSILKLSPLPRHNMLIEDDSDLPNGAKAVNGQSPSKGLSISPSEASSLAQWGLTNHALPSAPKKGLGNAVTEASGPSGQAQKDSWDEYPNGRFTDVRSPAYGEIDGWGSGLKTSASPLLACWL